MAEDKLSEILEKITDKFVGAEMLKQIEKAWPNITQDQALRAECANYIDNAPEDMQFKKASSLIKIAAASQPKQQDDSGFQKFLADNCGDMQLDEETIKGLRQAYNDMYGGTAVEETVVDDYKHQNLYKDLGVVLKDTLPKIEHMANQYEQAQALLSMQKNPTEMPTWSVINDQNGYQYAAMIFRNEYPPHASNEAEAVSGVDDIMRTINSKGLQGCLDSVVQKSAMSGIAMEVLGEIHPQFDTVDKAVYREQVKNYPSIAVVGLLRSQLEGKSVTSPQQLAEIINNPKNVALGVKLDVESNSSNVTMDKLTGQQIDVSNKASIQQFVQKDMVFQAQLDRMNRFAEVSK